MPQARGRGMTVRLLERNRRAPPAVILDDEHLSPEELLKRLLQHREAVKLLELPRLEQEGTLVLTRYRGRDERAVVSGKSERPRDGGALTNVERERADSGAAALRGMCGCSLGRE